jgi:hypothetical protein
MDTYFRVNAPDVTFEAFDGEVLVINLRSGSYYSLRESAVPIWVMLSAGYAAEEIGRELARVGNAKESVAIAAVDGFVRELESDQLVVRLVDGLRPTRTQVAVTLPTAFTPPVYDRYTDMQQLLMIDPIHEVDVTGWPVKGPPVG